MYVSLLCYGDSFISIFNIIFLDVRKIIHIYICKSIEVNEIKLRTCTLIICIH